MIQARRVARALCVSGGVCLVLLLTGPAVSLAASQPRPTLTGETFTGVPTVTATCDPTSNSTINYSVSGTATGPYPGTFTESGTATLGPQGIFIDPGNPNAPGNLVSFSATFTIQAATGVQIFGAMQLAPPGLLAANHGFCDQFSLQSFGAQSDYGALIRAKGAPCIDRGQSLTAVNAGQNYPLSQFNQSFYSNQQAC
jgi:hypothetical protein